MRITDFAAAGTTDWTPALNAVTTLMLTNHNDRVLYVPGDIDYSFKSRPNPIPVGLMIVGEQPMECNGWGAALVADYDEPNPEAGFLTWQGGVPFHGVGGGLKNIQITRGQGKTGGTAVKVLAQNADNRAGQMDFTKVYIGSGGGAPGIWDYGLLIDGTTVTNPGAMGVRKIEAYSLEVTNTRLAAVELRNTVHVAMTSLIVVQGPGCSYPAVVRLTGGPATDQQSQSVHLKAVGIWGTLALDYVKNFTVDGFVNTLSVTPNAYWGLVTANITNPVPTIPAARKILIVAPPNP